MLSMNKDMNKNLKDPERKLDASYGAGEREMSVINITNRTQKLVTALYMVTDMMSSEEPMKTRLRSLGVEIVSDMYLFKRQEKGQASSLNAISKISEVVSFLDIAFTLNQISEMNSSILKREFLELKRSINESLNIKPVWLEEFLTQSSVSENSTVDIHDSKVSNTSSGRVSFIKRQESFKGHLPSETSTRIGVQKASTLLQALKKVSMSDKINSKARPNMLGLALSSRKDPSPYEAGGFRSDFDMLKKQRRSDIVNIIKSNGGGSTIKDIRAKINVGVQESLACSEKTLQRELMSMTKDGVLNKTGEKRWSKYFIKA